MLEARSGHERDARKLRVPLGNRHWARAWSVSMACHGTMAPNTRRHMQALNLKRKSSVVDSASGGFTRSLCSCGPSSHNISVTTVRYLTQFDHDFVAFSRISVAREPPSINSLRARHHHRKPSKYSSHPAVRLFPSVRTDENVGEASAQVHGSCQCRHGQ
ncbi:hypothetical protein BC826DRAFT_1021299 [Russula brevipes]|nr:hypothetical protein BC826DRAFT_1021299 [Russula brevipes]